MVWAQRGARSESRLSAAPSSDRARITGREGRSERAAVSTLARQESSAYHARLFADGEGVVIVTPAGFTVHRDGRAPEQRPVPLGPVVARHGSSLIFWRSGWLREVSVHGGGDRPLSALARAPQHLLASDSRIAWVDFDATTGAALQTLSRGEVRVVHESADRVLASVLRDAVVYWIVQGRDASWTIGSVHLDGHEQRVTAPHTGRPPSMLALGPDGVYFYDGPERGVRRLTFELDREDTVHSDVICSPLVVSRHAICAQVGGLFEVASQGNAPRLLASEREGLVTALAATDERVFWIAETGTDRLAVRTVFLPGP